MLSDQRVGRTYFDYDQKPLSLPPTQSRMARLRTRLRNYRIERSLRSAGGERRRVFVHGHFVADKYRDLWPHTEWIAWFRDPIERLASHYHHWKRRPDRRNQASRKMQRHGLDLVGFGSLPEMRNVHARFLGTVTPEQMAFVGTTEDYDRSLELFTRLYLPGQRAVISGPTNRNPTKVGDRYELSRSVRSRLEELNAEDCELYARARTRFAELWRVHYRSEDVR